MELAIPKSDSVSARAIITSETVSRPNWWLSIMRASTVICTRPRPMMTMVAMADHFAPLMVFSRKLILVRRFVHEAFENGQKNNLDIEPEAPLADVLQIELDAFFHFFQRVGLASPAVDLRPAGDAWLHLMAQHVAFNQGAVLDRKSTRLNSSHVKISYAV